MSGVDMTLILLHLWLAAAVTSGEVICWAIVAWFAFAYIYQTARVVLRRRSMAKDATT